MKRKIKKLNIKVEKGCMIWPEHGEFMKQSITIKNNGQVWFNVWRNLTMEEVAKGFTTEEGFFVKRVKITEQKNIGKENTRRILERAEEVLSKHIDKEYELFICDAIPDEVLIEYEDGEIVMGQIIDSPWDFYKYLAEETVIENLFFFDELDLDDKDDED